MDEMDEDELNPMKNNSATCWETVNRWLDKLTINPDGRYKMLWDTFANTCYLISLFEVTFVLAFELKVLTGIWNIDTILDYVNLLDIFGCLMT
jgi:hypothetical protein